MPVPRLPELAALVFLWAGGARAEPAACANDARVSPCFDADPLWMPLAPGSFASVPPARTLPARTLSTLVGVSYAHRPVVLVAPSPHPEGREIPVVENTSTLTFGARYGLGYGLDAGLALPIVPYQNGTGTDGVTSQRGDGLAATTLRDPRLELAATLVGGDPAAPVVVGTQLAVVLPLGAAAELAGYAGPSVAPGFSAELELGRLTLAAGATARFREAASFGNVRKGSEASFAFGAAFELLRAPVLGLGVEASLRPALASPPAAAGSETLDLPAEWLASVRFEPEPRAGWSLFAGAGSGLPLSYADEPGAAREHTLGVTAPAFRAVLAAHYVLR